MSFTSDLAAFASKTKIRMDTVVRKVVIDITRDLVLETPVDTGHARSNWFWGSERVETVSPVSSRSGSPSIALGAEFAQAHDPGPDHEEALAPLRAVRLVGEQGAQAGRPGGCRRAARWPGC